MTNKFLKSIKRYRTAKKRRVTMLIKKGVLKNWNKNNYLGHMKKGSL